MSCVDGFYAIVKKDIFLTEIAVKQFFIYFFNDEGASSYKIPLMGFSFVRFYLASVDCAPSFLTEQVVTFREINDRPLHELKRLVWLYLCLLV